MLLGYQTANSGMTLGIGIDHVLEAPPDVQFQVSLDADVGEAVLTAEARPGVPIRIVKYITYQSSRSAPPAELVARCGRTLDRAVRGGHDALLTSQRSELDRFWDVADVVVSSREGVAWTARIRQAIRWNLFQLCQATWRAEGSGVPAKGLTAQAYEGHYFWDSEVYVLPFLTFTQPRVARNLLLFRHSMLPKARARAHELNQNGALFPWRTINGDEASAAYQAGTAQYHLNADIAFAIRRYVNTSNDREFLIEAGAEMLVETARLWEDLGFYAGDGQFHLHSVTGPDEYTTVVNDNTYTNLMARLNLNYAAASLQSDAGRAAALVRGARGRAESASGGDRRLGTCGGRDVRAVRRAARRASAGRELPRARGVGPRRDAAGSLSVVTALPPARHLPAPGDQAGRHRARDVPARKRVLTGAEAGELRTITMR